MAKYKRAYDNNDMPAAVAKEKAEWDPSRHKAGKQVIRKLRANKSRGQTFIVVDRAILRWRTKKGRAEGKFLPQDALTYEARAFEADPRLRLKKNIF